MTGRRRLRILIVDDHDIIRWGFRELLAHQSWVERCLGASDGKQALALTSRYEPHVALVDLFVGEESGAELCQELRAASRATRVLLISGVGSISPTAAKAAGASGFVSKDWAAQDVTKAVRMIGLGMSVFVPRSEQPHTLLSGREREVLELLAGGATNREIAGQLYLSPYTVKEYTTSLYRKLEVRNRAEAVQRAQRLGVIA